jgi:hypothetical protein
VQHGFPISRIGLFLPLGGEQSGFAMVAKLLQRELLPKKKAPLRGAFQRAFKDDHRRRAQTMSTYCRTRQLSYLLSEVPVGAEA